MKNIKNKIISLLLICLCSASLVSCTETVSSTTTSSEQQEQPVEIDKEQPKEPDDSVDREFVKQLKTLPEIPFKELDRNPDKYKNKQLLVKGIVKQVIEPSEKNPETNIFIRNENFKQNMCILYKRQEGQQRFMEGDYITAIVTYYDVVSLPIASGEQVPISAADINRIELSDKAMSLLNVYDYIGSNNYVLEQGDQIFIQKFNKQCNTFKIYDKDTKEYKPEYLLDNGSEVWTYNKEENKLLQQVFERKM